MNKAEKKELERIILNIEWLQEQVDNHSYNREWIARNLESQIKDLKALGGLFVVI